MAELVECARLEIAYTGNCIEGSNPPISASNIEHPVVIPRDVHFRPVSGDSYAQYYQYISLVCSNSPMFMIFIYLAKKTDASMA